MEGVRGLVSAGGHLVDIWRGVPWCGQAGGTRATQRWCWGEGRPVVEGRVAGVRGTVPRGGAGWPRGNRQAWEGTKN